MPYSSKAQQGYFHANKAKIGVKVVAESDRASKGDTDLPEHVKKTPKKKKKGMRDY